MKQKPITAVTMGDPAGIGPEITAETMMSETIYDECKPILIGSANILERVLKQKNRKFNINVINDPSEAKYKYGVIDLIEPSNYKDKKIEVGKVQKIAGEMSYDFILKSIELGMDKKIDIVSTAPIHKEAIRLAGCKHEGHTEIYGDLTNSDYSLTMFNCHNLKVFFISRHKSLIDAINFATKEQVLKVTRQVHNEMIGIGFKNPKIAVAALNPHASDNGLFGDEEQKELIPAVETAKAEGLNVVGPIPADSIFYLGLNDKYDAIISLYHDQGHIACKTYDFEKSITITWGLPFLRSSVDHGTAFDIAGKELANSVSMVEATLVPIQYWRMQQNNV